MQQYVLSSLHGHSITINKSILMDAFYDMLVIYVGEPF